MTRDETLKTYDRLAPDYVRLTEGRTAPGLEEFIAGLPPGARVLDLGCGPGFDAERMAAAGLDVLAVDGSAEMAALAAARPGVAARRATFDDIPALGRFGGVWASFSLLHAPRARFPAHLRDLHAACLPGARLAVGMKLGTGEGPDTLGRFYAYYSETELRAHLDEAGFTPGQALTGTDKGLAGRPEDWIVITAHA